MMEQAEKIAGLAFTEPERQAIVAQLNESRKRYQKLRSFKMENQVPLSQYFNPLPPGEAAKSSAPNTPFYTSDTPVEIPDKIEETAFYTVTQLSKLIKEKKFLHPL